MTLPSAPAYKILRIYLKGASVEVPHMARMPAGAISPVVGVDMRTEADVGWPGTLECVLRISLHAQVEGTTAFLIEVSVAGIFEMAPLAPDAVTRFVRKIAPGVLFPFARKDLATLAVAAGFQPVLLDHVDFDSLLTQVIEHHKALSLAKTEQLLLRSPHSAASVPLSSPQALSMGKGAGETFWPTTEPQKIDDVFVSPAPGTPPHAPERRAEAGRRRGVAAAVALAVLALAVFGWTQWPRPAAPQKSPEQAAVAPLQAPAASAAAPSASSAASPAASPAAAAAPTRETMQVLQQSRERIAGLPAGWRSVALGTMPLDADLAALNALPLQAPLYVVQLPDQQLQVLYGAFPTAEAAEAVRAEVSSWKADRLSGEPRVVTIGQTP